MIIAIDGPAGSGKSTVAKSVATELGFHYLDTGAMYRAVASSALSAGIDPADAEAVAHIAAGEEISFEHEAGGALASRVLIGGRDVTFDIRTPDVDDAVSIVARIPEVREALVAQQRRIAACDDVVVEGRDIGTVVFPDAEVKVFLTASAEERARRRVAQQAESGIRTDAATVRSSIDRRDLIDSTRQHSPLKPAEGAEYIDTTGMELAEIVERVVTLARSAADE